MHSSRRVAALFRVMWIELSLLMVFFVKCRKENIEKGCRMWAPGAIMDGCSGRRVTAWFFGCLMTVQAFRHKIPPPICSSIKPPHRLEIDAGERKSLLCVGRHILGRLPLLG